MKVDPGQSGFLFKTILHLYFLIQHNFTKINNKKEKKIAVSVMLKLLSRS